MALVGHFAAARKRSVTRRSGRKGMEGGYKVNGVVSVLSCVPTVAALALQEQPVGSHGDYTIYHDGEEK